MGVSSWGTAQESTCVSLRTRVVVPRPPDVWHSLLAALDHTTHPSLHWTLHFLIGKTSHWSLTRRLLHWSVVALAGRGATSAGSSIPILILPRARVSRVKTCTVGRQKRPLACLARIISVAGCKYPKTVPDRKKMHHVAYLDLPSVPG